MVQSNITGMFTPKQACLKINMDSRVIPKVDTRNPKQGVCVLVGLDFEDRLFGHEMFMLHLQSLFSLAWGTELRSTICVVGEDCAR